MSNIVVLTNKEKTPNADQYNINPQSGKVSPLLPDFNSSKATFSKSNQNEFKTISILNRTIFASPSNRKKKNQ